MSELEDRNLKGIEPLPTPSLLKEARPLRGAAAALVLDTREAIRDVLHGRDDHRMVVLAGPCSLHDRDAALEYAARLKPLADELSDDLVVLMRAYFEKPRSTVGWKGLVNDPDLDGSCNVATGLAKARDLLLSITEAGVPCATEFLDPITPQFLADGIAWAAIGARTTESQTHREMASGLSMPVGFKNGTDGNADVAIDAMVAASHPHSFLGIRSDGIAAVVKTAGNADAHLVLRGGRSGPNYDLASVERAGRLTQDHGMARGVMVDCSHGNSRKDPAKQADVIREIADQVRGGAPGLMGVMVESHLKAGAQSWAPGKALEYGVSITDGCISFNDTAALLRELAEATRERAPRRAPRVEDPAA